MIIKVLGSAGSEVPGHNCPAFLIDGKVLLDAGTIGLTLNIREERNLSWILLTHAHFDHIKGIPFLLDNLVTRGTGTTVTVLGAKSVLDDVRTCIFNDRIWPDFTRIPSPARPALRFRSIGTTRPVRLGDYRITMERVAHPVPAYGYIVETPEKKALAYTGDTGPTERFWGRVSRRGVKYVITEASLPNRLERLALAYGHLTPALLEREIAKLSRPPKKIFVMHLKPQFAQEIEAEIQGLRRKDIEFLKDGEAILL
ncbi:MAG TPA: 3',5'-cyclic-nucleotide phosphodiesterase [bacterium]